MRKVSLLYYEPCEKVKMFEFRAGRKRVVKSVETVEEANTLMRYMIAIRNDDSLW